MSETPNTPPPESDTLLIRVLAARDVPCTHCGHNLRDNTSNRCPECGRPLRIIVEADRLGHRAWLPAAALTFMAFAGACSGAYRIMTFISIINSYRTPAPAGVRRGPPVVPWEYAMDLAVALGIAGGATIGAVLAWRALRRADRPGLVRAVWRCVAVGLVLSVQMLANSLPSLLSRIF